MQMNRTDRLSISSDACPHLQFVLQEQWVSCFFPLLQKGVMVRARVGCSVKKFLCEQTGITEETLAKIQSIFLDGRPLDDLDLATIRDGSTLALSAAMPGLVGATLRRGGAYSSFRSTITYRETDSQCVSCEGFVQVKLFNLLMAELGPGFFKRGVFVMSSDLRDLLAEQSGDFWLGFRRVLLDGKPIEVGSLLHNEWSLRERVFLCVVFQE